EEHSSSPAGASFDVATVAEILDLTMVDDPPSTPALQARPEAAAGRVTEMEDGFRPLQSSPEEGIAPTRRMEEHELQERFETDSSVSSRPVTMVEPPPPPSTNEVPPLNPEPRATRYKVPRRKATVTSSRVRTGLTLIIVLLLVAGLTWYVLDKAVPDSNDEVNEQAALPTPAQDTIPDSSAAQSGDRQADAEMENSDNRPTVGAQAPPSAGPESEALKTLRFKHKMLKQDVRRFKGQENVRLLRAVVKDCEKLLNELAALEKEWTGQRVDNVTLLQERLETLTNKFIEIESEYKKRKMRIRNRLEKQN
ncbi:MAG: hypothetical protein QNK37_36945, partial [Acidobacteriota bacterium]|nr:hypothetical protein [Acidobacteriota bacterium]